MKVLLLGDTCNDVFVEGAAARMSPEVPVPVLVRGASHSVAGMAGNVLANLYSLRPGIEVKALLAQCGAKIRFLDAKTGHHFMRLDDPIAPEPITADAVLAAGDDFDAAVISDYAKSGVHELASIVSLLGIPIFVDTKSLLGPWSRGTIVKINEHEFAHQLANGVRPWEWCEHLIVTAGGDGIRLYASNGNIRYHVPAVPIEMRDGAGCGDTVLAALCVRYLESEDLLGAMRWAAKAGAVAVTKRGVVAVKREEIL